MKSLQRYFSPSQPKSFLQTDHLETNLKERSVKGGAITVTSQIIKFASQTGGTLILARLLTPEDFGLIGMVTVVLNFIDLFKDLGLSTATLQRQEISQRQVSSLFWINVALSFAITLITIALAPFIASFYGEPRLTLIVVAFASIFVLGGLTVQHQALLKRQMYFGSLARVEVASMLFGIAAAVSSAHFGAGYWSIVIWRLVQSLVNVIGVWFFCGWRPGLPRWDPTISSMLAFGGNITSFNTVNYFTRNLDNILIGRYWGAQQLGLYSLSYRLLLFPIEQINAPVTNVALPTLSRLQTDPERYCRYYYKAILLITTVGIPIVFFMFVSAENIIMLVLGDQWLGVVPIFRFLMPAAFFGTFNVATGWVYISLDRAKQQLQQGIVASFITAIIFIISVKWGAVGVAAGFGLTKPFIRIPSIVYCFQNTPLSVIELFKTVAQPTLPSMAGAGAVFGFSETLMKNASTQSNLLGSIFVFLLVFIGTWLIMPNGKESLTEIVNLSNQLFNKRRQS